MKALNHILNSRNHVKRREKKTFIVDATPVDFDFNFQRNKKSKEYIKTSSLNGVIPLPKVLYWI